MNDIENEITVSHLKWRLEGVLGVLIGALINIYEKDGGEIPVDVQDGIEIYHEWKRLDYIGDLDEYLEEYIKKTLNVDLKNINNLLMDIKMGMLL